MNTIIVENQVTSGLQIFHISSKHSVEEDALEPVGKQSWIKKFRKIKSLFRVSRLNPLNHMLFIWFLWCIGSLKDQVSKLFDFGKNLKE